MFFISLKNSGSSFARLLMAAMLLFSGNAWTAGGTGMKDVKPKGNTELPKVLYIIPWKQAPTGNLVGKPVQSLMDETLSSIDRNIFLREVSYYESLREFDRNNRPDDVDSNMNNLEQGKQE